MAAALLRAVALLVLTGACAAHLQVVGNPHIPEPRLCTAAAANAGCSVQQALDPVAIIRTPLAVQPDTFRSIVPVEYLGTRVPVYRFQQPARLSPRELPFSVVNVEAAAVGVGLGWGGDVVVLPVAPEKAADSWYLGYTWDVLLCTGCDTYKHLGWKFTSVDGAHSFYALIVAHGETAAGEAISLYGDAEALQEGVFSAFGFGVPAPAWLLALASASGAVATKGV